MYGMPRGIRNNNAGNIRNSPQTFKGEINPSQDKDFKQFETAIMGIRACGKILRNYNRLYGLSTTSQIIGRYAPSSENDTGSYCIAVAKFMGVGKDDPIDLNLPKTLARFVTAIIIHENGEQFYTDQEIREGVNLLFPSGSLIQPVS